MTTLSRWLRSRKPMPAVCIRQISIGFLNRQLISVDTHTHLLLEEKEKRLQALERIIELQEDIIRGHSQDTLTKYCQKRE